MIPYSLSRIGQFLRIRFMLLVCLPAGMLFGAVRLDSYYAHKTAEDKYGVLAPWSQGQNGPLDTRLRIAVEVMKRYPWVDTKKAVMAAPDFVYNSHWSIKEDGTILIPPTNDWMCGDLSQRAWSIIKGMTDYYMYSGDPIAFVYIPLAADYILDYGLTPEDDEWPMFPISTPTRGKAYGKCDPRGRNQLDLCAIVGTEILRAYKLTGQARYFEAARHWGDVFAEKCTLDPTLPPWNRYTHPEVVGWSDELTGSTTLILEFLDALIDLGYTGKERAIVRARDAGVRYINETLLPEWLENDHWGRQYWDWDNPVTCGIVSMIGDYIMKNPRAFPNWQTDMRNILTLIFNRNGADPGSAGNVFSGAWAFPESCTCCGTSLSYNQYTAAPTLLRFGVLAGNDRIFEIGRRMMIMATYDSHENGVVWDGLYGNAVATGEWSNLAHPWPMCQVMEAMKWTPEIFGPGRENHIVRSGSVVTQVVYEKNRIAYTTFDAPEKCTDVLRLSFVPETVTADGDKLARQGTLYSNGFTVEPLAGGDCIVKIRHDGATKIEVGGTADPQTQVEDNELTYTGQWQRMNGAQVAEKAGAEAAFTFVGNQVRVLGPVGPKGGLADVYLDGEKQLTLIDCWNPAGRRRQLLYSRSGLANGPHTLRIVAQGRGNLLSKGAQVGVDIVQYSDAVMEQNYGSGGGPTGTQRMIFGYPLRTDYVDSNGNAWRPATEWVIRSGYGTDTVEKAWWTKRRSMYIGNTDDAEIYRYGAHGKDFWANVTVGPGKYYVTLKFAETPLHTFLERDSKGQRITHTLTVQINEKEKMTCENIAEKAGGLFLAYDRTFTDIEPENGIIEVYLIGCDEQGAILQGMEVGPMSDYTGRK